MEALKKHAVKALVTLSTLLGGVVFVVMSQDVRDRITGAVDDYCAQSIEVRAEFREVINTDLSKHGHQLILFCNGDIRGPQ